ncbi:MAG TPA: SDR family NAD(P)-dependent oxidoreductase [Chloroflexia bacterium]|nr:SDR family NAD(P)-dependent oxidoreductase [Chloroflexia bacterium]
MGHLEAAAGVAGVIKTVLAMQHEQIPPHLHLTRLNPRIELEGSGIVIPREGLAWPAGERERYAAVSSFGLSGTNAHLLLQEAPALPGASTNQELAEPAAHLLALSARSQAALAQLAERYAAFFQHLPAEQLANACFSANTGRSHFPFRQAFVAATPEQLARQLADFAANPDSARAKPAGSRPKVAFLFTGQGSQYLKMGYELYQSAPLFRQTLDRCDQLLQPYLQPSLLEVLFAQEGTPQANLLDQTAYTQPALFALEYALAQLWQSWGVRPDYLLGHSLGEYVAACLAGVFSLEEGLRLVAKRAQLMQALPAGGAMAAVFAPAAQVQGLLAGYGQRLSLAAVNTANEVVVSGEEAALEEFLAESGERGIKGRRLSVSHAFHSALMEPMLAEYEQVLKEVKFSRPRVGLISNLTGELVEGSEVSEPGYWLKHLREAVQFEGGIKTLAKEGCEIFVEVGPKATLLGLGKQSHSEGQWLASLRQGRGEWEQLLGSLGEVYERELNIEWSRVEEGQPRQRIAGLPTYPFQRQRFWLNNAGTGKKRPPSQIARPEAVSEWLYEIQWQLKERATIQKSRQDEPGTWLLLADKAGLADNLAERLKERGQVCVSVARAEQYEQLSRFDWKINPLEAGSFERLLDQIESSALPPIQGVLYLWGLEASGEDALAASSNWPCGALLRLAQAVAARRGGPKIWLLTRGAQPVGSEPLALAQAPLWGLGRVISLEYSANWGGMLDLAPGESTGEDQPVLDEILEPDGEDQLAFRNGQRYVARLVPAPRLADINHTRPLRLNAGATYLITGGLGALGLQVAHWLVEQGARHLVLTGRKGLPDKATWQDPSLEPAIRRQIEAVRSLEKSGASVHCFAADVADYDRMAMLFGQFGQELPPLKGVVHAAGLPHMRALKELDITELEAIMRPKMVGGWVLHRLTTHLELDFFVSFSSIASVWGSAGMAAYAAGNQFLDALAQYRRRQGLPGLSLNWGPWSGGGMATAETRDSLEQAGITGLDAGQALATMGQVVAGQVAQAVIAEVNWSVFAPLYESRVARPLLEKVRPQPVAPEPAQSNLVKALSSISPEERLARLEEYVREAVAGVLGFEKASLVNREQGFFELGMDSLMAVELKVRLEKSSGLALPSTLAFDYPTVETLARFLADLIQPVEKTHSHLTHHIASDEPIAIVGMACRFPGGANSPEEFWQLLVNRVDAVKEVPGDRWDMDAYYDPNPETPGKSATREAAFLDRVDLFDAGFFGIAPREAASMDPQQRLLLEVAWEALENAGLPSSKVSGSRTGVFIGITSNDYSQLLLKLEDPAKLDTYFATGNFLNVAAGRLSYVLGLQGPSMAVDTACSSSLVAIHLACQSLRTGESDAALAGGVNLMLSPNGTVTLSTARMLSKDGRCKTFDANADGYGRGEGCGVVVLKRLSQAQADGDKILALIRGSAVNQDGPSSGLTVPNGPAQQALIRQALDRAGLKPAQVSYVEAHGTGTALGDPIELGALTAVLGEERPAANPLLVGSVKTNIGHLESAAGVAGVIKTVLALQHGQIPAHLHFNQPNPHIPWDQMPIKVPTETTDWLAGEEPRLAGVSSFGFSGTNAHLLLQEPPALPAASTNQELAEPAAHLLALSARSQAALTQLAERYATFFQKLPAEQLANACFSANTGRSHFPFRQAFVAATPEQLARQLADFAANPDSARAKPTNARPKVAFLFTGQGSQYLKMGYELYQSAPLFRQTLDRCDQLLQPYLQPSLLEVLFAEAGSPQANLLDQTAYTQPALFALEYALAQLWQSWGVRPDYLLGHSLGEYVAACLAGVFSLEEGLRLVAKRAKLMQALPAGGAMAAVFAPPSQVQGLLAAYGQRLSLAAVNTANEVVVSGEEAALEEFLAESGERGIKGRRLTVSHAFHSALMEPMLAEYEQVLKEVKFSRPRVGLISNLSGELVEGSEVSEPGYWLKHLREAVQFEGGIKTLAKEGCEIFVEVGPKATLLGLGKQSHSEGQWLASLRQGRGEWEQLSGSLGEVYERGLNIEWSRVEEGQPRQRVAGLPTYPFQRQRFWLDSNGRKKPARSARGINPLLGQKLQLPLRESVYQSELSVANLPFLSDHRVFGRVVVPGSSHVAMALQAARATFGQNPCRLADITFAQALALDEDEARQAQLIVTPQAEGPASFQILSLDETEAWTLHATGKLLSGTEEEATVRFNVAEALERCQELLASSDFYQRLWEKEIQLGTSFRWVGPIRRRDGEAIARMELPEGVSDAGDYLLHPGLIDSCFQLLSASVPAGMADYTVVPMGVEGLRFYSRPESSFWGHAILKEVQEGMTETVSGSIYLYQESGELAAVVEGLLVKRARRETFLRKDYHKDWLYALEWERLQTGPVLETDLIGHPLTWLILADRGEQGEALAGLLKERGHACVVALPGGAFEKTGQDIFYLDPANSADYHQLVEQALPGASSGWDRVVYMWGLDSDPALTGDNLAESLADWSASALYLAQALAAREEYSSNTRLWLVTRGAQVVQESDYHSQQGLSQAPLWGLGQVISLELPDLWGGLIDLDPATSSLDPAALAGLILSGRGETHLAWRGNAVLAGRLAHYQVKTARESRLNLNPDSSYMITGGLGGLGLKLAGWMASQGAKNLVLVSRSGISDKTALALEELKQAGCNIVVAQGDMAQAADLARILGEIQPPLRGVIHAAGLLEDSLLAQQDRESFARVMAAKAGGAWNLHLLTQDLPLDFFVLFSSAASLLGSAGQANYAAANAFMDSLAHFRGAKGQPALSINWGPWAEVGMAANLGDREQRRRAAQGMGEIGLEQGLHVLEMLLAAPVAPQLAVLPVDWRRLNPLLARKPLVSRLVGPDGPASSAHLSRQQLLAAQPEARLGLLHTYLSAQVSAVMGLAAGELDLETPISSLGLDSLMAVEIKHQLEEDLGANVPVVQFLQGPSVKDLSEMLIEIIVPEERFPDNEYLVGTIINHSNDGWEEGAL